MTLLSSLAVPRDRLALVFLNATAGIVHKAEIELRGGLALLGEPAETCRLFAPATTWNGWRGLFTKFFGSTRPDGLWRRLRGQALTRRFRAPEQLPGRHGAGVFVAKAFRPALDPLVHP